MAIDKLKTTSLEDNSVTSLKIAPGAVTNDDIPDSEIIADKLHTTLDFSTKTFTMHNNHVTQAMVTQHESALSVTASQVSGLATYLTNNDYNTATNIVAGITDSAPTTLDTLNELAAALADDPNFATTVTNSIATKLPLAGGTMTGDISLGDNVNLYLGDSSDASLVFDGTDTKLTSQGELILNGQTGITIDCNRATNQSPLHISNMGAGSAGIVLTSETRIGSITIGSRMDHARTTAIAGTNKSLAFIVNGSYGDGSYAAFDFTIDANGSSRHPAVMGVRSPNNNALLFQGEQSDSTVVFSVDYDGNVATSGTVDGVDIAARDAVLTSTTTTANAALPKTGGTITGDVTATTVNATTLDLGNWTITGESGSLLFAIQGVTKMKLDPAGNLDVVGNINSSAYIYSAAALIVNGKTPPLAFDFVNSYYRNSGVDSTFANSINHSRASIATMINSAGNLVTVGTNAPRIGHHIYDGTAWVNEGILHESEARTNLATYSNDFTASGYSNWLVSNMTVTPNSAISPDGTTNATELDMAANGYTRKLTGHLPTVGETYTASIWAKAGTASTVQLATLFSSGGLGMITENITLTDKWQRFDITNTVPSGTPDQVRFRIVALQAGTIFVYGAQIELGSNPSSYIPTSASTVTRAADILTVSAAKMPSVATAPFAEASGTEILTNSGFDTDTDWGLGTGFSIANGVLTKEPGSVSSQAFQVGSFTPGKMYKVEVDVTVGSPGGAIVAQMYGGGGGDTDPNNSSATGVGYIGTPTAGTYTWYIVPTINRSKLGIATAGGWYATITSVSVKEVIPPALSIQMEGKMTYADNGLTPGGIGDAGEVSFLLWKSSNTDYISTGIDTGGSRSGQYDATQRSATSGGQQLSQGSTTDYSPNTNVPFNLASRHGATFVNGATEGTLTTSVYPTRQGLPDLSSSNLQLGYVFMGTIGKFRMWDEDIGDTGIASASL